MKFGGINLQLPPFGLLFYLADGGTKVGAVPLPSLEGGCSAFKVPFFRASSFLAFSS